MNAIITRINQLQSQLNDPEIVDKHKIAIKLEAYQECLLLVKNEGIRESEIVSCGNCKYGKMPPGLLVCNTCLDYSNWIATD